MEEARRVMERLERIEALRAQATPARVLLAEVRSLLAEGEAWLAAERAGAEGARDVLARCRSRVEVEEVVPPAA